MNKELREQIYHKYDGRCAYCGREIEYKDMQVDHLEPLASEYYRGIEKELLSWRKHE